MHRKQQPDWIIARHRALGARIQQLRVWANLTQDALAAATGLDRSRIQRTEAGERDPRHSDLLLIARALGTPVSDLLREE